MATTNAQLIMENTVLLAMSGKIQPNDEIHTFAHWKSLGYSVRKGEKAVAKFPIWKMGTKKNDDGEQENTGRMFLKTSAFFATSQVEPLTARA